MALGGPPRSHENGAAAEAIFTPVLGIEVLGSSLSSGAARMRSRVRHEAPEDGVADAPLETPQSLLAGFALHHLLAVVGSAPGVRPGLAYCDHVQGVVELAVAGQRESLWRTTSPLEASTGAVPA